MLRSAWLHWVLGLTLALAAFGLHVWSHRAYIEDDAFISLRYSDRLLQGLGLTWTDGERVEGYTNFLWVVGTALVGALGFDLVTAMRILGIGGMAATLVAVAMAAAPTRGRGSLPATSGALFLAASGSIVLWAVGGLEQGLLAPLFAWALVTLLPKLDGPAIAWREAWLPGLLLGLCCLTRADAMVLAAATGLGVLLTRGVRPKTFVEVAWLGLLPALLTSAQLVFRRLYYGDWVPNTAYVKVSINATRLENGFAFVRDGLLWAAPLVLLGLVAWLLAFWAKGTPLARRAPLYSVIFGAWALHVILIGGGDTMGGRRHMVPLVVLLALSTVELSSWLVKRSRRAKILGWSLVGLSLLAFAVLQRTDVRNLNPSRYPWARAGEPVGNMLAAAFATKRPLIAVDAAGAVPFYSRLPALDMLGLTDAHIARRRDPNFGRGKIGHELGDGAYVLSRKPDLVNFCNPRNGGQPCWKGGREMVRSPAFRETYRLVHLQTSAPEWVNVHVWIRHLDGPLAIRRDPDRISVPGYFAATHHAVARLERGELLTIASRRTPAVLEHVPLPAGHWRLEVDGVGGRSTARVLDSKNAVLAEGAMPLPFDVSSAARVTFQIFPESNESLGIRSLELSRVAQ